MLKKVVSVFLILNLIACSNLFIQDDNGSSNKVEVDSQDRVLRNNATEPFLLEVLDEEFASNELFLTLGFVSFEPFNPETAVIKISTVEQGETLAEKVFTINKLHKEAKLKKEGSKKIELAVKYTYGVNIKAKPGIDYQVELLWGKDALSYLSNSELRKLGNENQKLIIEEDNMPLRSINKKVPLADSKILKIIDTNVSNTRFCHNKKKCEIEYKISANIINSSEKQVNRMTLAVGFLDKESKEYSFGVRIPGEEELLNLDSIVLKPGMNQSISITLDQRVPESKQQRYIPVLRVVQSK